jgi:hypothetical protein
MYPPGLIKSSYLILSYLILSYLDRLKLQHERLSSKWKTHHRKVRMAAILAAIRQIKDWDLKKVCTFLCYMLFF